MSEPLFSIVIACYNHEKFIREAVDSVLRQQHAGVEVIVVDDSSSDRSVEILKSYGDLIRLECLPVNRGVGAARNHGASVAGGRYLIFLDGDDALTPWALSVYGRIVRESSPAIILGRCSLFSGDLPKLITAPGRGIQFVEYGSFLDKDRPWVYNTSSLVVERAAFMGVGGWSPEIFHQDIQDLLNKLSVAHKTDLVLAPATVFYRMHTTNAVRQVGRFIDGVDLLLAKARQGAYPGGRAVQVKRSAWFGGLTLYWFKQGMRKGPIWGALRLFIGNSWMVALAALRRTVAFVAGRERVHVLALSPDGAEAPGDSDPARVNRGTVDSDYQLAACKAVTASRQQRKEA